MALLPILEFPDTRLRTVAKPVTVFDDALAQLAKDMLETMYAAPGIGLAASQVNHHIRMLVLDLSEDQSAPQILINPQIEKVSAETKTYDEGCLSVPGFYETVERTVVIRVTAQDLQGKPFTLEADGLLSVCIQHEGDHLDGKLFVDYLSSLKRNRIKTKLEKLHRANA